MKAATIVCTLAAAILCGCSIERFNKPPMGTAISSHGRFFGLRASIPIGGGERLGVDMGWGSYTWCEIPCHTNKMYAAPVSDTFSLGQGLNPFDTEIREDLQTGWEGTPPVPRYPRLFGPTNNLPPAAASKP